jgi:hypothetical protein
MDGTCGPTGGARTDPNGRRIEPDPLGVRLSSKDGVMRRSETANPEHSIHPTGQGAEDMIKHTMAAISVAMLAMGVAHAQESKVNLKNAAQIQAGGANNKQEMNVGNVKGKGSSNVTLENAAQIQAGGANNKQTMDMGSVQGDGKSNVQAKNVAQIQAGGANNKQTMTMGKVTGGGTSNVNAQNVAQIQAGGANNKQDMNVGNVSK